MFPCAFVWLGLHPPPSSRDAAGRGFSAVQLDLGKGITAADVVHGAFQESCDDDDDAV